MGTGPAAGNVHRHHTSVTVPDKEEQMTTLAALTTPCLLLEDEKLQANMDRLARRLHERGVSLRPHLKTCKNIEIARRCMESPSGPATVSTLAEAEYFAAGGVHGICYAVGIAPNKLERVAELRRRGIDLSVVLDNEESARLLVDFARQRDCRLAVLLEIDCDGHRAGLRPDDPRLTAIAALLRDGGQEVRGVLTHAGSAYDLPTTEAIAALAVQECTAANTAARLLREAGFPCPVVSVGSTPTAFFGEDFSGITEVRAGVYVFQDLVMAGLGVCRPEDLALSVLTTVIGRQSDGSALIIDAGWMALSRDTGLPWKREEFGYGLVCESRRPIRSTASSAGLPALPCLRAAGCASCPSTPAPPPPASTVIPSCVKDGSAAALNAAGAGKQPHLLAARNTICLSCGQKSNAFPCLPSVRLRVTYSSHH